MAEQPRIVFGRALVLGGDPNGPPRILEDGAALVADGLIQAIGALAELRAIHPDLPVEGGPGFIVTPGFVNAHHHVGLTIARWSWPRSPKS